MPRQDFQEEQSSDSSPPPLSFTAPTKAISNDGAGHGGQDAEETNSESDVNLEKEFNESTGMLA